MHARTVSILFSCIFFRSLESLLRFKFSWVYFRILTASHNTVHSQTQKIAWWCLETNAVDTKRVLLKAKYPLRWWWLEEEWWWKWQWWEEQ